MCRTKALRLKFIAERCPTLQLDAFRMLLQEVRPPSAVRPLARALCCGPTHGRTPCPRCVVLRLVQRRRESPFR